MNFQFLRKILYRVDPRTYQTSILCILLVYGVLFLNFEIPASQIVAILITTFLTQYVLTKTIKLPFFDPKSAMISGLSLSILLRTNSIFFAVITAAVTILSKFFLRWNNKHIFNPTNFGLVIMIMFTNQVWISPGQWGSHAFIAFALACIGGLIVNRSERSDVTYAFVASYSLILFTRSLWLGDPIQIPLHQLQNGAFLIFSFFMISDPKTTPSSRTGRILFAFIVAAVASYIIFGLYRPNGLLISLTCCSILVPLIDHVLPGPIYQWSKLNSKELSTNKTRTKII